MIGFRPAPREMTPLAWRRGAEAPSLGQAAQSPLPLLPAVAAGAAGLAFIGATGWAGIRTGLKEKGWLSALGWTTGIGGILFGGFFFGLPALALARAAQTEAPKK